MKKFLKTSLSFVLAMTVVLSSAFMGLCELDFDGLFAIETKAADSGSLGENVTWSYADGVLRVSGTGAVTQIRSWYGDTWYGIKSIVIEEGVTSICNYSFKGLPNLKSVSIPASITMIDSDAFYECKKLESVYITDLVAWCNITFANKYANPLMYADDLYLNNELLKGKVVIPYGATKISLYSFSCNNITSVVIPESVTEIGDYSFYHCRDLVCVTIPDSIVTIGEFAFGYSNLLEVDIPDSVTRIGKYAFKYCSNLKTVNLSANLTEIAKETFYYCTNLDAITIHGSIKNIGESAFYNCQNLATLNLSEGLKRIYSYAFGDCTSLTNIVLPDSIEGVGWASFWGCKNLSSITLPDSLTSIGGFCFYGTAYTYDMSNWDKGLLYINNHLIDVNGYNVGECVIKDGTKTIGGDAFAGCADITAIIIPDSVVGIGEEAFKGCKGIETITIPDSVTYLGELVFSNCTNLKSIKLSENITSPGYGAFENCTNLQAIVIPDGVTTLPSGVFKGCTNLKDITLPDSIMKIDGDVFVDTAFYTDADNWENNVLYISDYLLDAKDELLGHYDIKAGTKIIGDFAFYRCERLVSVKVPESVSVVGEGAFSSCAELTGVVFEGGEPTIENGAFKHCNRLVSVTLPEGIMAISDSAFLNCISLNSVNLPQSVTSVGTYTFGYIYYKQQYIKNDDFVICGTPGTIAEAYADENGFDFVDKAHTHIETEWEIIENPNPDKSGVKVKKCSICRGVLEMEILTQLKPEAPTVTLDVDSNRVFVTWNQVDGADEYIVYRRVYDAEAKKWSGWTRIAENVTREFYSDYNVASGTYYIYTVKGVNEGGYGAYTSGKKIYYLGEPKLLSLTASNNRMTLKWKAVEGATGYIVYRRVDTGHKEVWQKECVTKDTTYVVKNPEVDVMYRYTVKAYYGSYRSSVEQPGIFLAILPEPKLKTAAAAKNGVKVEWNNVKASAQSIVYRKTYDAKAKKWSGWTKMAIVVNDNYYVDTTVKSGVYYRYTVKAVTGLYGNGIAVSPYDKEGLKIYYMAPPTLKSATSTKSGVTLKWDKVKGAAGYIVYRKTSGSGWVKLATVKGNGKISYLDKNAKNGTGYTYTVRAYYGSYKSSYDSKGLYVKDKY